MEIEIRQALPIDEVFLTSISIGAKRYWNYSEEHLKVWNDDLTMTKDYISKNKVYVAQKKNTIIGYFSIVKYDEDYIDGNMVYTKGYWIDRIYIRAGYIRSGVGKELIEFAKRLCRENEINKLNLYSDILANGFFDKVGATYIKDCPSKIESEVVSLFELNIPEINTVDIEDEINDVEEIAATTVAELNIDEDNYSTKDEDTYLENSSDENVDAYLEDSSDENADTYLEDSSDENADTYLEDSNDGDTNTYLEDSNDGDINTYLEDSNNETVNEDENKSFYTNSSSNSEDSMDFNKYFAKDESSDFEKDFQTDFDKYFDKELGMDSEKSFIKQLDEELDEEQDKDLSNDLDNNVVKQLDEELDGDSDKNLEKRFVKQLAEDIDESLDEDSDKQINQDLDKNFVKQLEEVDESLDEDLGMDLDKDFVKQLDQDFDKYFPKEEEEEVEESFIKQLDVDFSKNLDEDIDKYFAKEEDENLNKYVAKNQSRNLDKNLDNSFDKELDEDLDKYFNKELDKDLDKYFVKEEDTNLANHPDNELDKYLDDELKKYLDTESNKESDKEDKSTPEQEWDVQIPGLEISEAEIAALSNPNLKYDDLVQVETEESTPEEPIQEEVAVNKEKQKMLSGDMYIEWGDEFINDRNKAKELLKQLNSCDTLDKAKVSQIAGELFGQAGEYLHIDAEFMCDYGYNISLGDNVFIGSRCTINDSGKVEIKNNCIISPDVKMYTLAYPLSPKDRLSGYEYARSITIGENVWIGGGTIINPGVTIGDNSVIAPGSVVTESVRENVLVGGNPARVIKEIDINED